MIDTSKAALLLEKMAKGKATLGSVESLTGGLFASTICSIPGASRVFKGAIVSYANEVKELLAGVSPATIEKYSVVSEEVAKEMAIGGLKALHVDVAVSFTGNAGPTAEPGDAPVGRVDMAIAYRSPDQTIHIFSYRKDFEGERNAIRDECVDFMVSELLDHLL